MGNYQWATYGRKNIKRRKRETKDNKRYGLLFGGISKEQEYSGVKIIGCIIP